ncbi:MAG: ADP-ribosylglycohydrolase family protein [Bacteroidota bacterium]|jgi:ADP-ribosylglycohydrolase
MFVESAVGDAFGFCYEFAPPDFIAKNNDPAQGYIKHPNRPHVPGTYSDDTQMAIAVAMSLLRATAIKGGSWRDITAHDLAREFVSQFKADPREGYSQGFYELLVKISKNKVDPVDEFLRTVKPHSRKSGGAMRAWPCGLLPTLGEAIDFAVFQASITHATMEGINAAAAVAVLVWACRQGIEGDLIVDLLESCVPGYLWQIPWTGPVGTQGIQPVKAAVTVLCHRGEPIHKSMTGILQESIAFTGDVDTVACIALAAASMHPLIVNDLPRVLYNNLEKGRYGMGFLKDLDSRMEARFPVVIQAPEPDNNPLPEFDNTPSPLEQKGLYKGCHLDGPQPETPPYDPRFKNECGEMPLGAPQSCSLAGYGKALDPQPTTDTDIILDAERSKETTDSAARERMAGARTNSEIIAASEDDGGILSILSRD